MPSKKDTILDSQRPSLAFVLNKESVLKVSYFGELVEMSQVDELTKDSARVSTTTVMKVVLSLNADTLFVITATDGSPAAFVAWDISSGVFKPGKRVLNFEVTGMFDEYNLVAVREGVLFQTSHGTLELWNFELSECIRSWTDLGDLTKVIPISEERVVCDGITEVIIVDTTREGILSTIAIHGDFLACNSKCHVLTVDRGELQMKCGDVVFWKIFEPTATIFTLQLQNLSPTEQFCLLTEPFTGALYVLDAVIGKILRTIQPLSHQQRLVTKVGCKFVSDECVVCFSVGQAGDHFLRLFNVKSGDLLSEIVLESPVSSLAACPRECLIAIGFEDSNVNFKVLRVKLPEDNLSRKNKRSDCINKEQSYNTIMTSNEPPEKF